MTRCFRLGTASRKRATATGLGTTGNGRGWRHPVGMTSSRFQPRLRVTLYRNRSAALATPIELGENWRSGSDGAGSPESLGLPTAPAIYGRAERTGPHGS